MSRKRLVFVIEDFTPDWAVHPGETLNEVLEERGWSQADFARYTGLSTKHINQIVRGKAPISPQVALIFEDVMHVSAEFWARLQAQYDVASLRIRKAEKKSESESVR